MAKQASRKPASRPVAVIPPGRMDERMRLFGARAVGIVPALPPTTPLVAMRKPAGRKAVRTKGRPK